MNGKRKLVWHNDHKNAWTVIPRETEGAICWQRNYLLKIEFIRKTAPLGVYRCWFGYATDKLSMFEREFYSTDLDKAKRYAISMVKDWTQLMADEVAQWQA